MAKNKNNETYETATTELEALKVAKKDINAKIRLLTQGNTYKFFMRTVVSNLRTIKRNKDLSDDEKITEAKNYLNQL